MQPSHPADATPSRPVPGALPLRPLTFGELLDAAVLLLRSRVKLFLPVALVLAALEQLAIRPVRAWAGLSGPYPVPYWDQLGRFWLAIAAGLGTEAVVLALLGALTGEAAGAALAGRCPPGLHLLRSVGRRIVPLLVVTLIVGVVSAVSASAVVWLVLYGMLGMVTPALMVERIGPFRALGRSFVLSVRSARPAFALRFAAYLAWLVVRLVLAYGGLALLGVVLPGTKTWMVPAIWISWVAANGIAYAVLACFDAQLYLESRMRTEGLDVALSRRRRTGRPADPVVRR